MRNLFILVTVALAYLAFKAITGEGFLSSSEFFGKVFLRRISIASEKFDYRLARLDRIKKSKSLIGQYNRMLNGILVDLGWRKEGITPGSASATLIVIAGLITFLVCFMLNVYVLSAIIFIVVFVFLFFLLFSIGKQGHFKHVEEVMEFTDTIAPVMDGGFITALNSYMGAIPESIRPLARQFIENVEAKNMHFADAMYLFTDSIGEEFEDFADKAIVLEYEDREGLVDIFRDVVRNNSRVREINRDRVVNYKAINRDYTGTLVIGVGFMAFMYLNNPGVVLALETMIGKIAILSCGVLALVIFSLNQHIQSTSIKKGGAK